MPHFDPPLRYKLTTKPIEVFAGPNGQSYWSYRDLLDCVLNAGELVHNGQTYIIDWRKYDYEVVGRVLEFLLQLDYSTVLTTDDDVETHFSDAETDDVPLAVKNKPRAVAHKMSKPGRRCKSTTKVVANHEESYKAKWDSEEPPSEKPSIGPWSPIDAFLSDKVCKDWMMTIEGYILLDEKSKELSNLAIELHIKVYIFAFEHDFPLLCDVAIQKLAMCLSRNDDCTDAICSAISTADQLLEAACYTAAQEEHQKIHELLEHYTALNHSKFLKDQRVVNEPIVKRAEMKLQEWHGETMNWRAEAAQMRSENAKLKAEVTELRRLSRRPLKYNDDEDGDERTPLPLRSGRVPKRKKM